MEKKMKNSFSALMGLFALLATALLAVAPASAGARITAPYGAHLTGTVKCFGNIKNIKEFKVTWVVPQAGGGGKCNLKVALPDIAAAVQANQRAGTIRGWGGKCGPGKPSSVPFLYEGKNFKIFAWRKTCLVEKSIKQAPAKAVKAKAKKAPRPATARPTIRQPTGCCEVIINARKVEVVIER
jgi:hypothetical protein